jgi:hypothetical protein
LIPWSQLDDVSGSITVDEGARVAVLLVTVLGREGLPDDPWGARWVEDRQLAMLAEDWAEEPSDVADQIIEYAVQVAVIETKSQMDRISVALTGEEE